MRTYPRARIYFLLKDPYWSFIWWELAPETVERIKVQVGEKGCNFTLRVYDVTDIIFDGKNAHWFFDIDVYTNTDHWYCQLPSPNRNYIAESGFKTAGGDYYPAARSSTLFVPTDRTNKFSTPQRSSLEI